MCIDAVGRKIHNPTYLPSSQGEEHIPSWVKKGKEGVTPKPGGGYGGTQTDKEGLK
jgi:hypothetical protein